MMMMTALMRSVKYPPAHTYKSHTFTTTEATRLIRFIQSVLEA